MSALRAPSFGTVAPGRFPDAMREYAAVQNQLDAPFASLGRDRWEQSAAGCAARAARRVPTGFTHKENKGPAFQFPGPGPLVREGKVLIDQHARRIKRMRGVVEHSMRLAESQLFASGGFRFRRLLVTLTYRGVDDWSAGHLGSYIRRARKWATRLGFALKWSWVAELQERGAVHYHVCIWIPKRHRLPEADLCGWWPHGRTNVATAKGGASGAMAYLGKYMSKATPASSMKFPKGARMFGAGGLDREQRREVRYRLAPFWVRDELGTYADIRRAVGGWMDRLTGLFVASPWKIEIDGSGLVWAYRPAV